MLLIRLMPDMQVGPLGGILLWGAIFLIAIGVLFTAGAGGAIVWSLTVLVLAVLVYYGAKKAGSGVV